MRILVSNDDGIHAKGLQTLAAHLSREHDVYVVAPEKEQSAMGHALTLHHPLRVQEVELPFPVKHAFSTSGTPSDCVKLALSTLLEGPVDIVVSGINHGPNLGSDVVYSGTVSAAMEGAFFNKPSIALSLLNGNEKHADFSAAARFITEQLPKLLSLQLPDRTMLNINFPAVSYEEFAGIAITKLGLRMYNDSYERRLDPRGTVYYWLSGELITHGSDPSEDVEAIRNNYVTISPVHADLTHYQVLERLEASFSQSSS